MLYPFISDWGSGDIEDLQFSQTRDVPQAVVRKLHPPQTEFPQFRQIIEKMQIRRSEPRCVHVQFIQTRQRGEPVEIEIAWIKVVADLNRIHFLRQPFGIEAATQQTIS